MNIIKHKALNNKQLFPCYYSPQLKPILFNGNASPTVTHLDFNLWISADIQKKEQFSLILGDSLLKKNACVIENTGIQKDIEEHYRTSNFFFHAIQPSEKKAFAFRSYLGTRQGFVEATDPYNFSDLSKRKEQWYTRDGLQPFPSAYPAFATQTRKVFNNYNQLANDLTAAFEMYFKLKGADHFSERLKYLLQGNKGNTMFTAFYPAIPQEKMENLKNKNILRQGLHTDIDLFTIVPSGAILSKQGIDFRNNYSGLKIQQPDGKIVEVFPDSVLAKDSFVVLNGEYLDFLTEKLRGSKQEDLHFNKTPHLVSGSSSNLSQDRINDPFFINLNLNKPLLPKELSKIPFSVETLKQKVPPMYGPLYERNKQYIPKNMTLPQFYNGESFYSNSKKMQEHLKTKNISAIWA